ncbi:MAG: hypothetical protein KIT31_17860 [Deltaproteobacteria bacterium]|nr:hypothetical protein [Deltaproteobacteria bacterium]
MRRLAATAVAAAAVAAGCSKSERAPESADPASGFCTIRAPGDTGPAMTWPPLQGKPPAPAPRWRWVNVWATYCKPCVTELPRIPKWQDRLASSGIAVDLTFVDVDADDGDVAAFRQDYPDTPMSLRLADPDTAMPAWFRTLGLTGSPTIPLQIFIAPSGKIRCVRAGSVEEPDYAAVEALLKAG